MNVLKFIPNCLKKIYTGKYTILNHITIFSICGIYSVITTMLDGMEKAKFMPDINLLVISAIILIITAIYLTGYTYTFINKYHDESAIGLPDTSKNPIIAFWKSIPLGLCWMAYCLVFSALCIAIFFKILIVGIILITLISSVLMSLIFVAFCENYDAKELFNVLKPFKWVKKSFKEIFQFVSIFIILLIAIIAILVISGIILKTFNINPDCAVCSYIYAIICGYIGFILQLIWDYGFIQIYKKSNDL